MKCKECEYMVSVMGRPAKRYFCAHDKVNTTPGKAWRLLAVGSTVIDRIAPEWCPRETKGTKGEYKRK